MPARIGIARTHLIALRPAKLTSGRRPPLKRVVSSLYNNPACSTLGAPRLREQTAPLHATHQKRALKRNNCGPTFDNPAPVRQCLLVAGVAILSAVNSLCTGCSGSVYEVFGDRMLARNAQNHQIASSAASGIGLQEGGRLKMCIELLRAFDCRNSTSGLTRLMPLIKLKFSPAIG